MDNKKLAQITNKAFNKLCDETSKRATYGSKKAALQLLDQMTAHALVLKSLGYMTTDKGRLVKWKPYEPSEYERLMMNASKSNKDAQAFLDYIENNPCAT